MTETPSSQDISTKLERIAKQAKEIRGASLMTLAHHIDVDWLREAYRRTRKDGARGVDGQSAASYAEHLEANLESLLDRAKSGRYRAPPVRRVHIPKGDGTETRPIGIPTFEDKVLQRAVAMVIGEVYEQEFQDFSYGFRPGPFLSGQACPGALHVPLRCRQPQRLGSRSTSTSTYVYALPSSTTSRAKGRDPPRRGDRTVAAPAPAYPNVFWSTL